MKEFWRRLRFLAQRHRLEQEMQEEMEHHLAMRAEEENDPEAARREFGNPAVLREQSRDVWGWRPLDELAQDVRYGFRGMLRQPGFSASAVLLLAFGLGANTAVFTLVRDVVLSTLPVLDPGTLVQILRYDPAKRESVPLASYFGYEMFAGAEGPLYDVFGFSPPLNVSLRKDGTADMVKALAVTDNMLSALGVPATAGVASTSGGRAVLSHAFWERRFGRDPAIIGATLLVNTVALEVAGVTAPDFRGVEAGVSPDVYFPIDRVDDVRGMKAFRDGGTMWVTILGRLRPGVTVQQATAELAPVNQRALEHVYNSLPAGLAAPVRKELERLEFRVEAAPSGADSAFRRTTRQPLVVAMAGCGVLLLLACTNLAGLVLSRGAAREREIQIRAALGCGRARMVRQLVTETLMLSLAGCIAAVPLAVYGSRALALLLAGDDVARTLSTEADWTVIAFLSGATLLTAILVGIVPALRSSVAVVRTSAGRTSRLARSLIATQIGLSVVLASCALLFVQTFRNYRSIDPGFRRENLIAATVMPYTLDYRGPKLHGYYREALAAVRRVPGVEGATLCNSPMGAMTWRTLVTVEGFEKTDSASTTAGRNVAGPGFARVTGLRLLKGRDFTEQDHGSRPALVNESFARKFFAGQDPLGREVRISSRLSHPFTVVGVVGDARDRGPRSPAEPVIYTWWEQDTLGWLALSVRTSRDAKAVTADLGEALRRVDPAVPIQKIQSAEAIADEHLRRERLMAALGLVSGIVAVAIAIVGLYALLAHYVARRTREIGIRVALGARAVGVLGLILGQSVRLVALGLLCGVPLAVLSGSAVSNQLFGVDPADPMVLAVAAAAIAVSAAVASAIPAFRATRVDPVRALRHD